jgi:hypothetical protein
MSLGRGRSPAREFDSGGYNLSFFLASNPVDVLDDILRRRRDPVASLTNPC